MCYRAHHVNGRIRLKVPALRSSEPHARALRASLERHSDIRHLEVRCASNSVIIHYDPAGIDPETLVAMVDATLAGLYVPAKGKNGGARPPAASARDEVLARSVRHLGVVFGQTAFKEALRQAVFEGVNSLYRATAARS